MEWNNRSAYLLVKTEPGWAQKVWQKTQSWKPAIGSWIVTGDWDVMVWVDALNWDEVYQWASALRHEKGTLASSSHWVHQGWKNGHWWWQDPAGAWVWWRSHNLNGDWKKAKTWKWAVSTVSTPGDWDGVTWVGGKNWNEVWDRIMDVQKPGWETKTVIPVRSWWNKNWQKNWWQW